MKWLIIPTFRFLYGGICFLCTGTDKKNLSGLRSYPDAVQSFVRERLAEAPKEKTIPAILLSNLILFTVLFSALGLGFKNVLAFDGYLSALWYFLILGEGLGLVSDTKPPSEWQRIRKKWPTIFALGLLLGLLMRFRN